VSVLGEEKSRSYLDFLRKYALAKLSKAELDRHTKSLFAGSSASLSMHNAFIRSIVRKALNLSPISTCVTLFPLVCLPSSSGPTPCNTHVSKYPVSNQSVKRQKVAHQESQPLPQLPASGKDPSRSRLANEKRARLAHPSEEEIIPKQDRPPGPGKAFRDKDSWGHPQPSPRRPPQPSSDLPAPLANMTVSGKAAQNDKAIADQRIDIEDVSDKEEEEVMFEGDIGRGIRIEEEVEPTVIGVYPYYPPHLSWLESDTQDFYENCASLPTEESVRQRLTALAQEVELTSVSDDAVHFLCLAVEAYLKDIISCSIQTRPEARDSLGECCPLREGLKSHLNLLFAEEDESEHEDDSTEGCLTCEGSETSVGEKRQRMCGCHFTDIIDSLRSYFMHHQPDPLGRLNNDVIGGSTGAGAGAGAGHWQHQIRNGCPLAHTITARDLMAALQCSSHLLGEDRVVSLERVLLAS